MLAVSPPSETEVRFNSLNKPPEFLHSQRTIRIYLLACAVRDKLSASKRSVDSSAAKHFDFEPAKLCFEKIDKISPLLENQDGLTFILILYCRSKN